MDSLLHTFCFVDDICTSLDAALAAQPLLPPRSSRGRPSKMCSSEIVCILLLFHQMGYRCLKHFYKDYVCVHLRQEFPQLLSYERFVERQSGVLLHMWAVMQSTMGTPSDLTFIDSTPLRVCRLQRAHQHKTFQGFAAKGKTSMGWFYGFKLHLVTNDSGELLKIMLTAGNKHDVTQAKHLLEGIVGKAFGDKGYISSSLTQWCKAHNLEFFTPVKKNMKPRTLRAMDAVLLRKRAIVETVIDQLKNISQIEHSRHRSPVNFVINVFAGLAAYGLRPKKPSLHLHPSDFVQDLVVC